MMLNVMLCDDEPQIREGLKAKIKWADEGFAIVTEAENGKEALDKLNEYPVDIVITDVKMPIMSGIDLAETCYRMNPSIKVIVISGYSDFDYAKRSIKAGVVDYLLKPVLPSELIMTLKKVRSDIENQRMNDYESLKVERLLQDRLTFMREQFLNYLVKDNMDQFIVTKERLKQLSLYELVYQSSSVQYLTLSINLPQADERDVTSMYFPFKMICHEYFEAFDQMFVFHDSSYTHLVHVCISNPNKVITASASMIKELIRKVKEYLRAELTIGYGELAKGDMRFKNSYISSLLDWSQSQVGSDSKTVDLTSKSFDFSSELERKMINTIESQNLQFFKTILSDTLLDNQSIMSFSFKANRILFLIGSLMKKYSLQSDSLQKQIWTCQQAIWELNAQRKVYEQLIELVVILMKELKEIHSSSTGAQLVEKVRVFITNHYSDEITLSTLASQFHINSTYLSEIFKLNIGKNFSEYLNDVRMEHSKKLLKDPHLKIIDVAHLVGFSNAGYFGTVFKKNTGMTPADYRKAYQV
ncbi:response regulator transcription factor [Alkalicoccobacillus gibsonii]|uniref:response regulator transcription factor n=1 Tax=Alkalicoccobacillus gibsonii TaxID=79881 RepID=UPI003F7CB963